MAAALSPPVLATDGDSLLRSVLERPADDAPRLVLADWYDEHGRPERGEFTRVGCELARLGRECRGGGDGWCGRLGNGSCRPCGLAVREWDLLCGLAFNWFRMDGLATFADKVKGPFGGWASKRSGQPGIDIRAEVRRGFVASVSLPTAAFLAHAPALFAAHPVTEVRLSDVRPAQAYGPWCWFGHPDPSQDRPDVLPEPLWLKLDGPFFVDFRSERIYGVQGYDTEGEAMAALSAACVAHGRQLAGLPPPPPT
jgi:uncharacterized protein (TIGR02996 family)